MSSGSEVATTTEVASLHNAKSETSDVVSSTDENAKKVISETKAKAKAITRRMSFSTTRPWSSYAENYSSCLSSLRRNSSSNALLSPRKGSLQSSSHASLSRSLDNQQLVKNLKTAATSTCEEKQRPFKVSPLHARPFHQRRWSSPVAFPIANAATSTQNLKNEAASNYGGNISDKMQNDKISETKETTLESGFHDRSVSLQAPSNITTIEDEEIRDNKQESVSPASSNTKKMIESPSHTKGFVDESPASSKEAEKDAILPNNHENVMHNIGDKSPEVINCKINSPTSVETTASVKIEENFQKINIYTEIKKNTKWSSSKKFRRRRHHTIHTDTRNFLPHNLSTIIEQSSISLDARDKAQNSSNGGGKLQHRRSRSLEDMKSLSEEAENKGVFVQRLFSKSLCVPIGSGNTRSDGQNNPSVTTVKYHSGEESGRSAINSINGPFQVNQVNVQTFSYPEPSNDITPQYRAVICGEQSKSFAETKISARPQHAVFTQAKPKWANITISQI